MGQVALSFWDYGLGNFGGVPDASLWAKVADSALCHIGLWE